MDSVDMYRRPYSVVHGQPFNTQIQESQPHTQSNPHYPFWTPHWVAMYQQQQRAAAMLSHGGLHGPKQTETKPRLAKDEVCLLEREFGKNPKPISSTKRELAEQMRVDVARINNWFQNRRAKEKHTRKTREFEEQQAQERDSPDSISPQSQESETLDDADFLGQSSLVGSDDEEEEVEEEINSQPSQLAKGGIEDATGQLPSEASEAHNFVSNQYSESHSPTNPNITELVNVDDQHGFDTPHVQSAFPTPLAFQYAFTDHRHTDGLSQTGFDVLLPQKTIMTDPSMFSSYAVPDYFTVPTIPTIPTFPSEMIHQPLPTRLIPTTESLQSIEVDEDHVKAEQLSPLSMSLSPPAPMAADLCFRSPPPSADIATRRNIRRPAPLGLGALRNFSHPSGPKTGIDMPRRVEGTTPMRRISSATGSLSGRIQKFGAAPRSPFCVDRNKEALMRSLQASSRSPVLGALHNTLSSLSPRQQVLREATASSDDEQGYIFGPICTSVRTGQPIKTPPATPGMAGAFPDHMFPHPVDQAWNFVPQDEPLPTPSLCSHGGSEVEFSMSGQHLPGYVASQPVTPSFGPSVGPTYNFFGNASTSNSEYTFPDSYPESSARSSPGQPKAKQFQFTQNVTPQDFNNAGT